MRRMLIAVAMGLLAFSGLAWADGAGNAKGCRLEGTFVKFNSSGDPVWTASYIPLTEASGMTDAAFVGFDLTLGGMFPDAVRDTGLKGTWIRTGRNSYAVTLLSIAADAKGAPQYSVKFTGTYTLLDACNRLHIKLTAGLYPLGTNPLTDAPSGTFPVDEFAYVLNAPSKK
jgi:hypothetical protein